MGLCSPVSLCDIWVCYVCEGEWYLKLCCGSTREWKFHLGKSLGLYEGFFWANSICKLKVIVTDAYVWALTQWYILEILTHNPHNNHVNSCYSWLKFGICPWSPGQSHHWTQVSLILNAVFVPLCYFVVLHHTWNVFWFRSMDNVKKHKVLEKLLG